MKLLIRAIGSLLYATVIGCLILGGVITIATQSSTIALFSTQSSSMMPRYPVHGLLVAIPVDYEEIEVGDAILVRSEGDKDFLFHRVTNVSTTVDEGETVYVTEDFGKSYRPLRLQTETEVSELKGGSGMQVGKTNIAVRLMGDANPMEDSETYLIHSQVWKPVLQIKGGGYLFDALKNPATSLWAGGILLVVIVATLLVPTRKDEEVSAADVSDFKPPKYSEFITTRTKR